MNKLYTFLLCAFITVTSTEAQVGIGTNSPDASAALDISSTDKGLLIPRMTTAQRIAITTPANSLMVFDTDTNSQWMYVDAAWVESKAGVGKFIDGSIPDIAYYESRVGIGLNAFSSSHKLFVKGIKDTEQTNTSVRIDAIFDGTGTSTATYGIIANAFNNSTGTIDYAIGTQGIIQNPNSGGTINIGTGSWPQIYNSGNMNYGSGLIITNANAGAMTSALGQDVGLDNKAGANMGVATVSSLFATNNGTISGNSYGLYIDGEGSGSIGGNSYALYLATPFSNVSGDSFAFYSENLNNSYMAGNLGIGTDDPLQKVHISGAMQLEPQATAPSGGALGVLYVGTDGNLYFHNGTDWKAVQLAP